MKGGTGNAGGLSNSVLSHQVLQTGKNLISLVESQPDTGMLVSCLWPGVMPVSLAWLILPD